MHRIVQKILSVVALAVVVGGAAPAAWAVQSSASLSVFPSNFKDLQPGSVVDVGIMINNTSSETQPDGLLGVDADVKGPITVKLGCIDNPQNTCCAAQDATTMTFVPTGPTGCVSGTSDVLSCTGGGTNTVTINLDANGVKVPLDSSVLIATVKVVINGPLSFQSLGIRAETECDAIRACSVASPGFCATCAAEGCSVLNFRGSCCDCPHACPNHVSFLDGQPTDAFDFHFIADIGAGIDPSTSGFTVSLANNNPIFSYSLPPNTIKNKTGNGANAKRKFQYDGNFQQVKNNGGIDLIKIFERDNLPPNSGIYRLDVQVRAPGLKAATTNPDRPTMTVVIQVGGSTFTFTKDWTRVDGGWVLEKLN